MKASFLVLLCFASHLLAESPTPAPSPSRLYLHFFTPTYYDRTGDSSTPPKRIISAEVYPSQDFDIALGTSTSTLRGYIKPRGSGFHAHIEGTYLTTTSIYEGDMELEKPVMPTGGIFSEGIFIVYFALSANSDCKPILKQQAARDEEMARRAKPK